MADRLTIKSGETHTVSGGTTETYTGADISGTLDVDGTLELIDLDDEIAEPTEEDDPTELPTGALDIEDMQVGLSVFLIGVIGGLGAVASLLNNYAAVVMLMLAVVALLASGLLGIGLELFWMLVIATVLLIAAGAAVRWSQ